MRGLRWVPLVLLALLLPAAPALGKPEVLDVRLGLHPDKTRVVLDLTEAPGYRIFPLADPYRMVVDLSEVVWRLPDGHAPQGRGLVQSLRYGLFAPGTSRVVLDLAGPTRIQEVQVLPPSDGAPTRLVIDLAAISETDFQASLRSAPLISSVDRKSVV